jgi:glycosyltransferase involved in cell wall biosynthesis
MGEGGKGKQLKAKYQDDRIIFTDHIADEKVKRDVIQGCDIFVLPSLFEGMSLALLEAMSSGLACIATDVGTTAEMIKSSGILLDRENIKPQLKVALEKLLSDPELRKKYADAALKRAREVYDQEKTFADLISAFGVASQKYRQV